MTSEFQRLKPPVFPVGEVTMTETKNLKLNNGIPVFLIESGTEDIIRLEFTFRAGQIKEDIPLLASTANMMLTEGSTGYTAEEINRALDYHGAFLNSSFEKDRAGIIIYLLSKHLQKILEISREILFRPVFPESELEALMRKRLRWYMVNREKIQNIAMDKFMESIFGSNHPYGRQVVPEDFGNITSEMLRKFHNSCYSPRDMAIIVSGRPPADTLSLLDSFFGNLHSDMDATETTAANPSGKETRMIHIERPAAVQTAIRIGSATINKRHPDYPGLKIIDTILGGYFGSRLMKNIREEKGYTYGINSIVTSLDLAGYMVISTEVNPRKSKNAIEEIYREIELLQDEPVSSDELELVRNYMSGEMLRMFDGPFALAESFRSAWEFGLDNSYYTRLAEKIRTIEPDEIIRLAQTYYKIDELYQVTVGLE